jgi:hypothetical protein
VTGTTRKPWRGLWPSAPADQDQVFLDISRQQTDAAQGSDICRRFTVLDIDANRLRKLIESDRGCAVLLDIDVDTAALSVDLIKNWGLHPQ